MKRFLNKALLYKEWKTCKWCMLIFTLIDMYFVIGINDSIGKFTAGRDMEALFFNNSFNLWILSFVPLVIYASTLVGDEFSGKKYEIFTTMPFTREEIVINKWFMGTVSFLIPLIIIFVMFTISFVLKNDALSYSVIFGWFILNALEYTFVFTFVMLIQFLSGKNILGCIFGTIFLFLPVGLWALFTVTTKFLVYGSFGLWLRDSNLETIAIGISLVLYNSIGQLKLPMIWSKMIILTAATAICLLLAVYAFKKYSIENIGCIVAFKKLEFIFKLGTSICFGLLGSSIYSAYQAVPTMSTAQADRGMAVGVLIALIVGVITYFTVNKIIKASRQ